MRVCFLKASKILHLVSAIATLEIKVTNIKKIDIFHFVKLYLN